MKMALFLGAMVLISSLSGVPAVQANKSGQSNQVVVVGRVICLGGAGKRIMTEACGKPNGRFGFEASDGKIHTFAAGDRAVAMFADPRVTARELQLTAVLHKNSELEIIKVHSIKDARLHDIYYFCEVCNITAYEPGPCTCCRAEMEFRETPVSR
jgi:hypothetical protein